MSEQVKILQRLPKTLHEQLKGIAKESELSVNAVIVQACEAFVQSNAAPTVKKRLDELEAKFATLAESGGVGVAEEFGAEEWRKVTNYHQKRLDATWETVLKLIKRVDYLEGVETEDSEEDES